ncbi:hypothetical protein L873DRAFT_1776482 [Choiromyces venosus 120613-1]|uniref:HNH nuclease domain-containing protein n=1 Tax=Choiromyces venosus 120613-1 TaxID=1336337 RepID=A0A3N4JCT0_9PEZI|nr:hypothetical protein L873DRAFT_1776482 [Choiromyces venosus 120613-1]
MLHWKCYTYGSWITILHTHQSYRSIHCVQNRILLSQDIHTYFDSSLLILNPDLWKVRY